MADLTLPPSDGSFETIVVGNVAISKGPDGTTQISDVKGKTLKDQTLTLSSENNEGVNATISSEKNTALKNSSITTTDESDTLIITGNTKSSEVDTDKSKDIVNAENKVSDSEFDLGAGKDRLNIESERKNVAVDSSFDLGKGNDKVLFDGGVRNVDVDAGPGEDVLIFGGKIKDTRIQLGSDGQADRIEIRNLDDIDGLIINGADANDVLVIGSTEYQYDPDKDRWVNGNEELRF